MTNPNFNVRFYVRTTKTQGGDSPTPLRAKVWISATKQYVYFSTTTTTTKRKWADFATDGTPSPGADPELVRTVDAYKAAAQLVLAGAAANNRIHLLTSDELNVRINAVVTCMEKRQREEYPSPILVFTTPNNVPLCRNCQFCGDKCKADWSSNIEADTAPDLALYKKKCDKWSATKGLVEADVFERLIAFYVLAKSNKPHLTTNDALGEAVDLLGHFRAIPDKAFKIAQQVVERNEKEGGNV